LFWCLTGLPELTAPGHVGAGVSSLAKGHFLLTFAESGDALAQPVTPWCREGSAARPNEQDDVDRQCVVYHPLGDKRSDPVVDFILHGRPDHV
jgi:hypothetical protein